MSWLARSIAATLSSAPSDDDDDDHSEPNSGDNTPDHAEEDEQPDTPSRGVKGDISELTESLTRRFWGVATFLAPPPAEAAAEAAEEEPEAEDGAQSPRVAGIRSDLAEIGGRVRSGISMLSNANAVAEISKIASSFLPFVPEEEEEVEAVGVTEEVVVFVRHISTHPETWRDFPLFVDDDRHADDFELSDTQYEHALAIERIVPSLSYLRTELCSSNMSEACFWKIYFVLLHSKLHKQDAELLSTTQILEAREELLQSSPRMKKLGSQPGGSSENKDSPSTQAEDTEFSASSIQYKSGLSEATTFQEPTPDPLPGVEAIKHPISTSELEIVDKSVIEEVLVVKNEMMNISEKPKLYTPEDDDDKEVEEWLEDMDHVSSKSGNITFAGHDEDEDVSFSDLEDDE
ncbi:uncharacterized protein LOC124667558 [Lolium rigidum]|uniref:uncharacterized protein LOC124667558 n=1 Tax=Lolium rigidum TaxID=89674 RepID=UPI001F5DB4D8|nr:uncharacterized protein LOC124667558 [Lolium rigidum]